MDYETYYGALVLALGAFLIRDMIEGFELEEKKVKGVIGLCAILALLPPVWFLLVWVWDHILLIIILLISIVMLECFVKAIYPNLKFESKNSK
jgi:hypothetical protein